MAGDLGADGSWYVFPGLMPDRRGRVTTAVSGSSAREHPSFCCAVWEDASGARVRLHGAPVALRGDSRHGAGLLAPYKMPYVVSVVPSLPKSSVGKILR